MDDPLLGNWTIKDEHPITEEATYQPILVEGGEIEIYAGTDPNKYKLVVPFVEGEETIDNVPKGTDKDTRFILAAANEDKTLGIRLVFEPSTTPKDFVGGILGSTVERWPKSPQPSDMGVITGTKG